MPMRLLLPTLLVASTVLVAPRAHACECIVGVQVRQPADGSMEVPTNARIWIDVFGDQQVQLRDDSGAVVPTVPSTITAADGSQVTVLTPTQPLVANAAYSVRAADGEEVINRFTTGTSADTEAPSMPEERGRNVFFFPPVPLNSCGPAETLYADLALTTPGILTVVDRGGTESLDGHAAAGRVAAMTTGDSIALGRGNCLGTWSDVIPGAVTEVRYGAFDLAGNFSGWSEPTPLVMLPPGCACADARTSTAFGALLLLLPAMRRRRR